MLVRYRAALRPEQTIRFYQAGRKCKRILQKTAILHKIFFPLHEAFIKAGNHL